MSWNPPPFHIHHMPWCSTECCSKPATVEIRNHRHELLTRHCATHGKRRLEDLLRAAAPPATR